MSDQSSLNSAGAAVAGTPGAFASLDLVDQITNLNARLSALENAPAPVAVGGDISPAHRSALARCLARIFGEELTD